MRRLAWSGLILLLDCSTTTPEATTTPCTAYFSGNSTAKSTAPQCVTAAFDLDAGGWTLAFDVSSDAVPALHVEIDLGAQPVTGSFSSDTVTSWSAVTNVGADACALGAGNAAVPTGSFTLAIQSVTTGDAATTMHGTLDLVLYVHAPPQTDCGQRDIENVEVRF